MVINPKITNMKDNQLNITPDEPLACKTILGEIYSPEKYMMLILTSHNIKADRKNIVQRLMKKYFNLLRMRKYNQLATAKPNNQNIVIAQERNMTILKNLIFESRIYQR